MNIGNNINIKYILQKTRDLLILNIESNSIVCSTIKIISHSSSFAIGCYILDYLDPNKMLFYVFVGIHYCTFKQNINLRVNQNVFTTL